MYRSFATFNVSMWWRCNGKWCFCGGFLVDLNGAWIAAMQTGVPRSISISVLFFYWCSPVCWAESPEALFFRLALVGPVWAHARAFNAGQLGWVWAHAAAHVQGQMRPGLPSPTFRDNLCQNRLHDQNDNYSKYGGSTPDQESLTEDRFFKRSVLSSRAAVGQSLREAWERKCK
jgi:hypothetical protein